LASLNFRLTRSATTGKAKCGSIGMAGERKRQRIAARDTAATSDDTTKDFSESFVDFPLVARL
jgi:hypothetical protein